MGELSIILYDLKSMFQDIGYNEINTLFILLLMSLIYLVPLTGVDCSHEITELTFIAFAVAYGVIQWCVLPSLQSGEGFKLTDVMVVIMVCGILATLRMNAAALKDDPVSRVTKKNKEEKP